MSEILEDFLTMTPSGLYCIYGDFHIDPQVPVPRAVISHAHGDHARPGNQVVYCTPATQSFMECRYGKKGAGKYESKAFHEDRKSTRLNSSHVKISYAVFCL